MTSRTLGRAGRLPGSHQQHVRSPSIWLHRLTLIVAALAALHSLTLANVEAQGPPEPAEPDEPAAGRVEVRVWQHVADPLRIYISARPEGGSWHTLGTIPLPLDDGFSDSGNYRYGDITVEGVEVRAWQRVADSLRIYISARPEGGSWHTLGTIPLPLDDGHSSSGNYRYGDITVEVPLVQRRPVVPPPGDGGGSIRFELTPTERGWTMHMESDHDIPSFGIELQVSLPNTAAVALPNEDIKAGVRQEVDRRTDPHQEFLSSEATGSVKTFQAGTLTHWTCERQAESWRFDCAKGDSMRLPSLSDADNPHLWVYVENHEGLLAMRVTAGDVDSYFPYVQATFGGDFSGLDRAEFCGDFGDALWAQASQVLMDCPGSSGSDELEGRPQHTDVTSVSVLSTGLLLLRCDRHETSTSETSVWACESW